MTTQPFWADPVEGDAWDVCQLGGEWLPGLCEVKTTVKRDVKIKKAKGKGGASMEDQGNDVATGTITLKMWTSAQWTELLRILPTIQPRRPEGAKDPLELVHPEPNAKAVTQVFVDEIPPFDKDDKGLMTVTFKFTEWCPAPKPVKAGKKAAKTQTPTPEEALIHHTMTDIDIMTQNLLRSTGAA